MKKIDGLTESQNLQQKIMVVTYNSHFVIFLVYNYSYTMINHTRDNCKSTYNYFGHIGGQLFLFEVYNKSSLC